MDGSLDPEQADPPDPDPVRGVTGSRVLQALGAGLLPCILMACPEPYKPEKKPLPPAEPTRPAVEGTWRARLHSPGGELPFTLRIFAPDVRPPAVIVNGAEEAPLTDVHRADDFVALRFRTYDAEILVTMTPDAQRLFGEWRKTVADGHSVLPFTAERYPESWDGLDVDDRFGAPHPPWEGGATKAVPDVSGSWEVRFVDEEGPFPAVAELHQEGERVTGTFLTATGDYRFLEGRYTDGLLRLSTFDGSHAFLFQAWAEPDRTLSGEFWSRDTYHATWTAKRVTGDASKSVLPDPYSLVSLRREAGGRLHFAFPDLEGTTIADSDPRFSGKVVIVDLFGSWCPNCNDLAPLLASWHARYAERGLEIVGLAFELTGDLDRDADVLRRFRDRYDIRFPLLVAGVSDKAKASDALPDLTPIRAYPTTIFIGRDGIVRRIHSGFAGPGTGPHYDALVAELEGLIESLLAEAPAAVAP